MLLMLLESETFETSDIPTLLPNLASAHLVLLKAFDNIKRTDLSHMKK